LADGDICRLLDERRDGSVSDSGFSFFAEPVTLRYFSFPGFGEVGGFGDPGMPPQAPPHAPRDPMAVRKLVHKSTHSVRMRKGRYRLR
jgi:hypothetical protein